MRFPLISAFVLPGAVIGALALAPMAMANTMTTGVITSIDTKSNKLTLDNGSSYMLPKGFKDTSVKVGDKVVVAWEMKGTAQDATSITMAK